MGKSLIDAIGRKKASRLMEYAVLRAIEENQTLNEDGIELPLARRRLFERPATLKRSVPIA